MSPTKVTSPTWSDHVYSCNYVYASGVIALSVKELSDASSTTAYYQTLADHLGRKPDTISLGQGAFITTNGSVIVRKDFKVLDVDVSQLPAQFGQPPQNAADVALSVAATVMGCWTDA